VRLQVVFDVAHLIAAAEHGCGWSTNALQFSTTDRRGDAKMMRSELRAGFDQHIAGLRIGAAPVNRMAGRDRFDGEAHRIVAIAELVLNHGIEPVGHGRAGGDLHAGPGRDPDLR